MEILLDESNHQYTVDGEIASISITELLAKHHLAPDYGKVDKKVLKAKAEEGKKVHKDLENLLNKAKYKAETPQGEAFDKWVDENVDCAVGEQPFAYKYNTMLVCGTADVVGQLKDGSWFVGDHKTTSAFNRSYVSWQVSLLDYFARQCSGQTINGHRINWVGATKFYCFHYNELGELKVYELDKVDDGEIERLLNAEFNNEIYLPTQLIVDNELITNIEDLEIQVAVMERQLELTKQRAEFERQKLLKLFEEQRVISWESPSGLVKITYIAPHERMNVDTKKLKEKYPQAYEECQKPTQIKASLRINVRED